ncbi:2-dehydro-3-deoxyphosphogluconate aldolase/(4S)-4-hydroxy-2-oxoglutarate aldolase [Lewinella marina]|uniref:Bifunctional 4-hydroxy-2-oxoglutarate aldolase/2-dehydro-3-deoxy-phosphogluconate aldolase n=1 Tax=Neolewinella marina TaxID=438751 RepID=A0A2G0CJ25_9BACT|nr:bifunctional 4-hydroxy-2-oxoglutarate aldolase/2-dehydro-3-deoxy-phosphogluconate aldolase [Neolewinella marina]NJB84920.1 2-dehydro-3-deoxyphosphogluconate aldolase/(4S)-4-hydroxy-2-oxoglutarate aldolase [Neolewinella marina]PHK99927.1 bifunctional 4-hydroxy-2-oxoglutarate aldolase/2-dehydro-3-deoxy-phosphogluconate aldolase [Neolewinella marina]
MATHTRLQTLSVIHDQGIMPLFYHPDAALGKEVLRACYDAGGRLLEFTNRGDFAHEVFRELNVYARKELPEMVIGVGSVNDAATAALFLQLGASFIVSASLREDIALVCNRRKVAYLPGCATLTEIGRAEELGCEIVKLFPGSVYGPEFIKSVRGPQPWTSIMPTGGVTTEVDNLRGWYSAGAVCVGLGSQLIGNEVLKERKFDELTAAVRQALSDAKELRK